MSKIGTWSTTAGNNNATPPDGWPEGQAPSTVNDCAREMMAQLKAYAQDAQFYDPANTPSYLSATTFSLGVADTTTFHAGRRVKLFDATTLYGTIDSVSSTFVSVRLDSGALTASLSSVAVSIVSLKNSALPEQAQRRQNAIVNGNMDVWQRTATVAPANAAITFTADRFRWIQSCGAAVSIRQVSIASAGATDFAPTIGQTGARLTNALHISVGTIDAALGANEHAVLSTIVEGYDWRMVAGRPNVLSFWATTNRSGVYAVALRSSQLSASFVQNYTVGTINTWVRYAITIPEMPVDVTWDFTNGKGVDVVFGFGVGSNLRTPSAGEWAVGNYFGTSTQTNFLASAGNAFILTGLRLEVGETPTAVEIVPYEDTLAKCQRYYWKGLPCAAQNFPAWTRDCVMSWPVMFPCRMRTTPTLSANFAGITTSVLNGLPQVANPTVDGFKLVAISSAISINCNFVFGANDYIEADAEIS